MNSINHTSVKGRAVIDGVGTTLLPAKLTIRQSSLEIEAFFCRYFFPQEFVSAVEQLSPDGIAIRHMIRDYPTKVSFYGNQTTQKINSVG